MSKKETLLQSEQIADIKVKSKTRKRFDMDNFQLWTLAIIPVLIVLIFSYVPMGGLVMAFKNYNFRDGIFGSPWVGFENFKLLLTSNTFARITRNTLLMNFIIIFATTTASVMLALLLFQLRSRKGTKLYQTVMITPNFLSWVVVSYMAYTILHPTNGSLNGLLALFGVEAVDWYSTPGAWPIILTICAVWKSVGMDSLIYYATLMSIDTSLIEAAQVDGANKRQVNRHIMLPGLAGIICIQVILKIGNIFRADFGLFYQIPRNVGTLYSTTDVIDTYIFRAMREYGDMGISSATGLLQSVVGFALVMLTNYIVNKVDEDKALF